MIQCIRCGHHCKNKLSFQKHCLTKNKCVPQYIFISKQIYWENYLKINDMFKNQLFNSNKLRYGCYKCSKLYKDRSYYFKHLKKCSGQNLILLEKSFDFESKLILYNFDDLIPEIISSLPNSTKKQILLNPDNSLIQLLHLFQLNLSENQNIYIQGHKEKYGYVYKNGYWHRMIINQLMDFLLAKLIKWLYWLMMDKEVKVIIIDLIKIFDKINNDKKYIDELKNNLRLIIYHERDRIKHNYEKRSGLIVKYNMKINKSKMKSKMKRKI